MPVESNYAVGLNSSRFDLESMDAKLQASLGHGLYDACIKGDLDAVSASISQSKKTNPSFSPPFSSIMYAAMSKDRVNVVEYCLDNDAEINPDIMRILLINRARETYGLLLARKAVNVDYYIPWFDDILSNAATKNDLEWAKFCLDHGADSNQNLVDEHKSVLAAVAETASLEMATLLIRHGAHVAGSGAIVMAAEEGKLDMVKLLLSYGADINEIGIEHPTDPRFKEDMGSALHRAVEGGHLAVVDFLLDQGAVINLRDVMGRTPLVLAEAKENSEIVGLLKRRDP